MTDPRPLRISWDAITSYPITLQTIKDQLRIDHEQFDPLIMSVHLPAAITWAETETKRSIVSREHRWVLDSFPIDRQERLDLPRGKTQSVASIAYVTNGSTTTLTGPSTSPVGTGWVEDLSGDSGGVLMPTQGNSWPSADIDHPNPVTVTFTAGWLAAEIPPDLVAAIIFYIGDAIDLPSSADLGQYTDLNFKDGLVSRYRLGRWF